MDSLWSQLRDLFEHDDRSLPELELTHLRPETIPSVLAMLWRRGHDVTAGGASYCDQRDGRDNPIASTEDAVNAALLVCSGVAQPLHVVLRGLGDADAPVPDLGVFVHQGGLIFDYRMGPAWKPHHVVALFELLLEISAIEPEMVVRHQYSDETFDAAWKRYKEARRPA
jgi:hypothetical protein